MRKEEVIAGVRNDKVEIIREKVIGNLIIIYFIGLVVNIEEVRISLINYLLIIFAFLNLIIILILVFLRVSLLLRLLLTNIILGLGRFNY